MKNFIIGYGETLTTLVDVPAGGGGKKHPYTLEEGRKRFIDELKSIINDIEAIPAIECANDEVVIKFIQHPSYLAKTYYPKNLFKKFGIRDVGSRSILIKPEKWAVKDHPEEGAAACIYVAGKKSIFNKILYQISAGKIDKASLDAIRTIETIALFKGEEKIKKIDEKGTSLRLEVVIHASEKDNWIIQSFDDFLNKLGGKIEKNKIKITGGLTFFPVIIDRGGEVPLARFSHLRALRSVPKLRFNKPNAIRQVISNSVLLPPYTPITNSFKVCVFDGGIGEDHALGSWVKEIIPDDIHNSSPEYLSHGGDVCSTYLFGPYNEKEKLLDSPYTMLDIVRVISPDDGDPDLFDVLSRIEKCAIKKEI